MHHVDVPAQLANDPTGGNGVDGSFGKANDHPATWCMQCIASPYQLPENGPICKPSASSLADASESGVAHAHDDVFPPIHTDLVRLACWFEVVVGTRVLIRPASSRVALSPSVRLPNYNLLKQRYSPESQPFSLLVSESHMVQGGCFVSVRRLLRHTRLPRGKKLGSGNIRDFYVVSRG
jgi:hypothetical protein